MRNAIVRARLAACGVAGAALVVRPASAQVVNDYNAYKFQHYLQTTAAPPTTPTLFYCNFGFDVDSAGTFTTGTVTWTTTTAYSPASLTLAGSSATAYNYWWPGPEVTTKAQLDAICPVTTYTFAVSGGTLGAVSGALSIPADAYSPTVPGIDSATFTALSALVPSSNVKVSTVAHTAGAGTQFNAAYLSVDDAVSNANVASSQNLGLSDGGIASLQIEAGTLLPAHAYRVSVDFTDRVIVQDDGFGGATGFSAFEQTTEFDFETLLDDGGTPPGDGGVAVGLDATAPVVDAASPVDAGGSVEMDSSVPSGSSSGGATTVPSDEDSGAPAAAAPSSSDSSLCDVSALGAAKGGAEESGVAMLSLGLLAFVSRRRRAARREGER